jgi:hypothetical protein
MTTTPQPVEIHTDRTTARRARRTGFLGGAGLFAACVLVCCLPLVTAAAAAIGLGAVATGAWVPGAVVLGVAGVAGALVLRRRRTRPQVGTSSCSGGCGC